MTICTLVYYNQIFFRVEILFPLGYTAIRLLNRTVNFFSNLPRLTFLTFRFNNRITVYPSGSKNSTLKKNLIIGSLLVISPHIHSIWMPLVLDYLFEYQFLSRIWLLCKVGNEIPQMIGNLHIQLVPIPVSYLSTLPRPIPSPVYGIISRCPIGRIQVASDSTIDTSWIWSASRTCPIW